MGRTRPDVKRQLAEDFGMLFDAAGVPRMAGRIFGWLMVCDPPQQSAADLAKHVGASKGSISAMTRLLQASGIVERFSIPGKRATYFRIKENPWAEMMTAKLRFITAFRGIAEKGLTLLANEPASVRRRLTEMRDTYSFFEQEFARLTQRLKQGQRRKGKARRR